MSNPSSKQSTPLNDAPDVDTISAQIARDFLNIDTLSTRKSDSFDFHDCAVWQIKAALAQAYARGIERGVEIALR
jgi:hypothetical protein